MSVGLSVYVSACFSACMHVCLSVDGGDPELEARAVTSEACGHGETSTECGTEETAAAHEQGPQGA